MSKHPSNEELEAGMPTYRREEVEGWQGLILIEDDDEPEAGRPYYLPSAADEPSTANSKAAKLFNVREAYEELMQNIRKPRSYEADIEQAKSDKRLRQGIAALSVLVNTAKGVFGGSIRPEDYSGIEKAENEVKAYGMMENRDTDRYEDDKNKLWINLYNIGLKDDAANRTHRQKLEQIFTKEGADARNIDRCNDATKEQIGLRGDVSIGVEDVKQQGRETLGKQKFGQQLTLETVKQQGRERLKAIGEQLKQTGQLNKPFIDILSPYGGSSIGLTKGEALEFFSWLLANGNATQDDYSLMIESLTGTAANNIVQSKVVSYANRYPQTISHILTQRGKGQAYTPPKPKGNPLQSRTVQPQGKGNPLAPRK